MNWTWIIAILTAQSAFGADLRCAEFFVEFVRDGYSLPAPPSPLAIKGQEPTASAMVGISLGSGTAFPRGEDGTHVFAVVRYPSGEERVLISPRTLRQGAPHLIATHSLLFSQMPAGSQLLAAGELLMLRGRCREVTNGSGTYRGKQEQLRYALHALVKVGVPIESDTRVRDYSKEGEEHIDHVKPETLSRLERSFRADPALNALISRAQKFLDTLYEVFPTAPGQPPGAIDLKKALATAPELLIPAIPLASFIELAEREGLVVALISQVYRLQRDLLNPKGASSDAASRVAEKLSEFEALCDEIFRRGRSP